MWQYLWYICWKAGKRHNASISFCALSKNKQSENMIKSERCFTMDATSYLTFVRERSRTFSWRAVFSQLSRVNEDKWVDACGLLIIGAVEQFEFLAGLSPINPSSFVLLVVIWTVPALHLHLSLVATLSRCREVPPKFFSLKICDPPTSMNFLPPFVSVISSWLVHFDFLAAQKWQEW